MALLQSSHRPTRALLALSVVVVGCSDAVFPEIEEDGPFRVVAQSKQFILAVDESERFVNLAVGSPRYEELITDPSLFLSRERLIALTDEFFQAFDGDFDFVIVAFDPSNPRREGAHFYQSVRNTTSGLGLSLFERDFGQWTSRLDGIILMRSHVNLRAGPSLHEIAHRWAQFVLPSISGAHWGAAGVGGQLGGWMPGTLEDLGGGRYQARGVGRGQWGTVANGGNSLPYAPIELYLMGLLPADSVPDFTRAIGAVVDPWDSSLPARAFTAIRIDTLSIEGFQELAFGPRLPAWPTTQRRFEIAYIVVSADLLRAEQWPTISDDVRRFVNRGSNERSNFNFWEATGGRAELSLDEFRRR